MTLQPTRSSGSAFLLIFFLIALGGLAVFATNKYLEAKAVNPSMVKLADGQIFFGDLHDTKLCNYVGLQPNSDPKTHKSQLSIVKGGSVYGGDGCLDIREPIAVVEKLQQSSPLYAQITNPNAANNATPTSQQR
jgi:hypothetical protein